ncbi:MAG: hypothetical protein HONBIEJF_02448 [Fimbriimonadaceae bacterium]|nr:hypothetical protein [Fimbriimonadaceae bacterium]
MKTFEEKDSAPTWMAIAVSAAVGAATYLMLKKKGTAVIPMLVAGARNGLGSFAMTKLATSPFFRHSYNHEQHHDGVHSKPAVNQRKRTSTFGEETR